MPKSLRRIAQLALLTLAIAAPAAEARPYFVVNPVSDVWVVFDPSAREQASEPDVTKVWMVTVQRNILTTDPPQPGYVRSLNEYDCKRQRMRWLNFAAFFRDGSSAVERVNPSPQWEPVNTSRSRQAELSLVCGQTRGRAVVAADSLAKIVVTLMGSWDALPVATAPVGPPPVGTPKVAPPTPKAPPTNAPAGKPATPKP